MNDILILSFSDLEDDPRVNRQIGLLSGHYRVTAVGFADPKIDDVEFLRVDSGQKNIVSKIFAACKLKLGLFDSYYWNINLVKAVLQLLGNRQFDLVIANDLNTLPLAVRLAGKGKVVFDAHEYASLEFEDLAFWRFFFKKYNDALCRLYLPRVHGMWTVCQGIADKYRQTYGVSSVVVTNAPLYHDLQPTEVSDNRVRMIHHGAALPSRKLEIMIDAMRLLDDRYTLDLMLVANTSEYIDQLKARAEGIKGVRFIPPVSMSQLSSFGNDYDVGIFLLPPTNFNYQHALPNKFFEFIQSRLCVAIGPSPEMAYLIKKYDCGIIANEFTAEAMANELKHLSSEKLRHYKQRAHVAAQDLCFDKNSEIVLGMVNKLLAN